MKVSVVFVMEKERQVSGKGMEANMGVKVVKGRGKILACPDWRPRRQEIQGAATLSPGRG
jgi:hypothetical protein